MWALMIGKNSLHILKFLGLIFMLSLFSFSFFFPDYVSFGIFPMDILQKSLSLFFSCNLGNFTEFWFYYLSLCFPKIQYPVH